MKIRNIAKAKEDFLKSIHHVNPEWETTNSKSKIDILRLHFNDTFNTDARRLICGVIKDIDSDHHIGDLVDEINTECEIIFYDLLEKDSLVREYWNLYYNVGNNSDLRDLVLKEIFRISSSTKEKWYCFEKSKNNEHAYYYFSELMKKYHKNVHFLKIATYPEPNLQTIIIDTFIKKFGIKDFMRRLVRYFETRIPKDVFTAEPLYTILRRISNYEEHFDYGKKYLKNRYENGKKCESIKSLYKEFSGKELIAKERKRTVSSPKSITLSADEFLGKLKTLDDIESLIKFGIKNKYKVQKTDVYVLNYLFKKISLQEMDGVSIEVLCEIEYLYSNNYLYMYIEDDVRELILSKIKSRILSLVVTNKKRKNFYKYVKIIRSKDFFTKLFAEELPVWEKLGYAPNNINKYDIIQNLSSIEKVFNFGKKYSMEFNSEAVVFETWFRKINEFSFLGLELNKVFRLAEIVREHARLVPDDVDLIKRYTDNLSLFFDNEFEKRTNQKSKEKFIYLVQRNIIIEPLIREHIKSWKTA